LAQEKETTKFIDLRHPSKRSSKVDFTNSCLCIPKGERL